MANISLGIVGLPNVGKSTLFNALTKKGVPAENYPFCTIDPSVGIVAVPDERLWKLSKFSNTQKTVPAVVEFVDIAGLVKGASKGEGLGNKFLANIRECDAIGQVVRLFEHGDIQHVEGNVHPLRDVQIINAELALADLETIEKRIDNLQKEVRRGDAEAKKEEEVLKRCLPVVNDGLLLSSMEFTEEEAAAIKKLNLLSTKPILYILNKSHGKKNVEETDERFAELAKYISDTRSEYVIVDAKVEDDLKDFEGEKKKMFRQELIGTSEPLSSGEGSGVGVDDDGIDKLIKQAYKLLGLETYFTTGEKETRAWTIAKDSTAPVAGMAIHTDFKDRFIKALIIDWQELLNQGSFANAKATGKLRTEGKEYIVKDGDVIEFMVN
jgi:GTP-binding protein YchF